jgi:DNA helicase-2/ATP-dependent DNA helicase PcrA
VQTVVPLLSAHRRGDQRAVIDLLRSTSPTFDVTGVNAKRSLRDMIEKSNSLVSSVSEAWDSSSIGHVLRLCSDEGLVRVPERLREELGRAERDEEYNEELHSEQRGEWLADAFFRMSTTELEPYADFILQNTPYSTQHGVKGEEYVNVLVVYDDVEAGWNNYNFAKLLTPQTAGEPTDGQRDRGKKLAYVSFSRAEQNLRILLFTRNPEASRDELSANGLFREDQIVIAN